MFRPFSNDIDLRGCRVLITGAARGIGAALADRLHQRGAKVALVGLEPERLAEVAARCDDAPWAVCDVGDRHQVDAAVAEMVDRLGGLDVVVANAGIAAQLPIVDGDPAIMEATVRVILLGAYSASKAGVEALGNTLRIELAPTGATAGVAYFAELDTDMTSRGFGTEAATALTGGGSLSGTAPLEVGIDALERGITRRSRRIVAPWWVAAVLPTRMVTGRFVELYARRNLVEALRVARGESVELTTPQPGMDTKVGGGVTP